MGTELLIINTNLLKHNHNSTLQYVVYKINDLVRNKPKHYVAVFKDYLIYDDITEFMETIYSHEYCIKYIQTHSCVSSIHYIICYRNKQLYHIMQKYKHKQKALQTNNVHLLKQTPHPSIMLMKEFNITSSKTNSITIEQDYEICRDKDTLLFDNTCNVSEMKSAFLSKSDIFKPVSIKTNHVLSVDNITSFNIINNYTHRQKDKDEQSKQRQIVVPTKHTSYNEFTFHKQTTCSLNINNVNNSSSSSNNTLKPVIKTINSSSIRNRYCYNKLYSPIAPINMPLPSNHKDNRIQHFKKKTQIIITQVDNNNNNTILNCSKISKQQRMISSNSIRNKYKGNNNRNSSSHKDNSIIMKFILEDPITIIPKSNIYTSSFTKKTSYRTSRSSNCANKIKHLRNMNTNNTNINTNTNNNNLSTTLTLSKPPLKTKLISQLDSSNTKINTSLKIPTSTSTLKHPPLHKHSTIHITSNSIHKHRKMSFTSKLPKY